MVFHSHGNVGFSRENPLYKWMMIFRGTPICGNLHCWLDIDDVSNFQITLCTRNCLTTNIMSKFWCIKIGTPNTWSFRRLKQSNNAESSHAGVALQVCIDGTNYCTLQYIQIDMDNPACVDIIFPGYPLVFPYLCDDLPEGSKRYHQYTSRVSRKSFLARGQNWVIATTSHS